MNRKEKGITLISLIITIIILIILAGIAITLSLGNNGIFTRAKQAKELTNRQSATEELNIKITAIKIDKYAEKQQMPTLKELAEELRKDDDIKYILETSRIAEVEYNVPSEKPTVIYVKLKKYPYEFEINDKIELVKIDGKKLEQTGIGASSNTEISIGDFEIITPYIGTSSVTVKINKETIKEEISKYVYIIGNIVKEETVEEITIEELEANREINITVIAITKTNKHLVARKIVKTEPKTYLYNNGDQCTELTGGWKAEKIGTGNRSIIIKPEIDTNKNGGLYAAVSSSTSDYYAGSITINNKINYAEYKKICFRITATAYDPRASIIDLYANSKNIVNIARICGNGIGSNINNKIVKYNIDQIENIEDIFIYLQAHNNGGYANCTIYEVWLEK